MQRRISLLAALVGVASMGLYAAPAAEAFTDPPRRRRQPMQTDVLLPAGEPEVLSKRAQRRARGKAKAARRG